MPHEELREQNIDHVLETAYALFLEHGIENTTKEMLARASKVSRSSLDRYFRGKADCVIQTAEWVENHVQKQRSQLLACGMNGLSSGLEKLSIYLDFVERLLYQNPQMFVLGEECRTYLYRNDEASSDGSEPLRHSLGRSDCLCRIFAEGTNDGSMRPQIDPEQEAILVRESYLGLLSSIAIGFGRNATEKSGLIRAYQNKMLDWYAKTAQ